MRRTALLLSTCLLAACSLQPPQADAPTGAASVEPGVESPTTGPDAAPGPGRDGRSPDDEAGGPPGDETERPPGDTSPDAATCDPADVDAMDAQVAGQLEAIAEQDWEAALGFATSDFRADHDDERFARVITDGFPVVAANASHRSEGCVRAADAAQLLVTVTADDGATSDLVYLMGLEDETWRIGGAVPHGAGDEPDTRVV